MYPPHIGLMKRLRQLLSASKQLYSNSKRDIFQSFGWRYLFFYIKLLNHGFNALQSTPRCYAQPENTNKAAIRACAQFRNVPPQLASTQPSTNPRYIFCVHSGVSDSRRVPIHQVAGEARCRTGTGSDVSPPVKSPICAPAGSRPAWTSHCLPLCWPLQ